MSLILDALRKSDRQRNRQAREQLRWGPGPVRPAQQRPHLALVISLLLGVLLLVGASAWFGSWLADAGMSASDAPVTETDVPLAGNMENGASNTRSNPASRGEVRALQGELAGAVTNSPDVADADADDAIGKPVSASELSGRVEDFMMAPALSEMPEEFRDRLPRLAINVHAWTESPAQRFVVINMQRYTEGERLREGPRLLAITSDGAVLEYEGERFTLSQR